jgi:hypothetical protein
MKLGLKLGLIRIMSLDLSNNPKKSLLTNVHCRHREEGEEEEYKIKVKTISLSDT